MKMPIEESKPVKGPAPNHLSPKEKEESLKRLPKRLIYVLRYGAIKEGLTVDENGFVPLDEVLQLNLISVYSRDEVMHEIESSVSYRTIRRYESRQKDGHIEVRAAYLRRFEENPVHPGTNVKTLVESAMSHVISNLDDYDLEDFPDESIIRRIFHRLKRQKKLTVKALQTVLVPTLTGLDLEGVFLTNNTMRTLYRQCPNLTQISFKGCGYIMTDTVLSQICKNLPGLQRLNLCQCNHLTSQCLTIMAKRLPHLRELYAAGISSLIFKSVVDYLSKANSLTFLDIYFMLCTPDEYEQLMKTATSRSVTLILRKPKRFKLKAADYSMDSILEVTSDDLDSDDMDSNAWNQWMDYISLDEARNYSGDFNGDDSMEDGMLELSTSPLKDRWS